MVTIRLTLRRTVIAGSLLAQAMFLQACTTLQPANSMAPGQRSAVYKVGKPYQVAGIWYVPQEQPDYDQTGIASWYGDAFQMKATASGELFDMNIPSAAHTTLPLPSIVEVTNLDNGRKLRVRVNDRGPFVGDRIIDLSRDAARQLGYERQGLARVRVRYVGRGDIPGDRAVGREYAAAAPAAPLAMAAVVQAPVDIWTPPLAEPMDRPATVAPPQAVAVASLAPLAATPMGAPAAQVFRVQAGAFSDQANAQRAVAQLTPTGQAVIEPLQRDGVTLYRVVVPGGADEVEAEALRQRVAATGFADARVLRPF